VFTPGDIVIMRNPASKKSRSAKVKWFTNTNFVVKERRGDASYVVRKYDMAKQKEEGRSRVVHGTDLSYRTVVPAPDTTDADNTAPDTIEDADAAASPPPASSSSTAAAAPRNAPDFVAGVTPRISRRQRNNLPPAPSDTIGGRVRAEAVNRYIPDMSENSSLHERPPLNYQAIHSLPHRSDVPKQTREQLEDEEQRILDELEE
jgi:hypothetical protein